MSAHNACMFVELKHGAWRIAMDVHIAVAIGFQHIVKDVTSDESANETDAAFADSETVRTRAASQGTDYVVVQGMKRVASMQLFTATAPGPGRGGPQRRTPPPCYSPSIAC